MFYVINIKPVGVVYMQPLYTQAYINNLMYLESFVKINGFGVRSNCLNVFSNLSIQS